MSKFKVGDIIEHTPERWWAIASRRRPWHTPEYEENEPGLYIITKVTKYEYELTTTVEPLESYMIHKSVEDWPDIRLVSV